MGGRGDWKRQQVPDTLAASLGAGVISWRKESGMVSVHRAQTPEPGEPAAYHVLQSSSLTEQHLVWKHTRQRRDSSASLLHCRGFIM